MRKRGRAKKGARSTPWGRWLTPLGTAILLTGSVAVLSAAKAPQPAETPERPDAGKANPDAGDAKADRCPDRRTGESSRRRSAAEGIADDGGKRAGHGAEIAENNDQ